MPTVSRHITKKQQECERNGNLAMKTTDCR